MSQEKDQKLLADFYRDVALGSYVEPRSFKTTPNMGHRYYGKSPNLMIVDDMYWGVDYGRSAFIPIEPKTHLTSVSPAWRDQPIPDPNPFNKPISSPSAGTRAKLRAKRKKSK